MPKVLVVLLTIFACNIHAQIDSIWQSYYDSTDLYWGVDWNKTERLLVEAKIHLEDILDHPAKDSTYNLTLNDLGASYHAMSRYEEAMPLYLEAVDNTLRSMGPKHSQYGQRLNNLSQLYSDMGRYEEALPLSLEALENTANSLGMDHSSYGIRLNNLSELYRSMGRYEEALPLSLEALENTANSLGKEHSRYGTMLSNLGQFYRAMGRYDEALPLLLEALQIIENSLGKEHASYGLRLAVLGGLYKAMGQYEEALPLYRQALENISNNLGKQHFYYGQIINNLGTLYTIMGLYEEALPLCLESLENTAANLGRDHSQYGIRLHNLGHLHSEMGRFEEALPLFLEAVENTANSLGKEHSNYGTMLNNLSELYEDMGLYEDALPLFLEANTNLNRQLNQVFGISSEKNKQDFLNTFNNYFQQYHSFAFASDYRFDNLNIMLFDNELQQKGLILNSTKQTIEAVRESGDSSLIGKFTAWKNLRSQLAQQYSKPIAKRMAGLDSLEQLANTWEQELVQKSSAFATIRMPVSWQTIRDQLKKHEVAIEFVHFQYRNKSAADSVLYAAMILSTESARPEIIPLFEENELLALISKEEGVSEKKFIKSLYNTDGGNNALYTLLWSRLESELEDIQTVYYAPSGLLHQISIQAIAHPDSGYLSDHYRLIHLNSTRQLVSDKDQPSYHTARLYGGIEYQYTPQGEILKGRDEMLITLNSPPQERSGVLREFKFLRGTLVEVERIGELFWQKQVEAAMKTGHVATEEDFKAMSGNSPKVLHIATHGFFFPNIERSKKQKQRGAAFKYIDNPLFRCGLAFAGSNYAWKEGNNPYELEDGILTGYEISNLDLSNTDLVVLSACKTGLGEIKGSEGVYGLQRAFKMAGVDNLIMSLWQVPDQQTTELMELFYSNWLEGYDIRSAFDNAQKAMSERHPPYYWAAFVMVGDVVVAKDPTEKTPLWVWIICGAVLIGAVGYGSKRLAN